MNREFCQVINSRSTRARLTLYFTAVFGVMVVLLAAGSYSVFRHEAYADLDSALNVAASATAMSAAHELSEHSKQSGGEADLQSILDASSSSTLPNTQILVREGARDVAHKSVAGPVFDLRNIPANWFPSTESTHGLRIVSRGLYVPRFSAHYTIYAASSVDPVLAKLRQFSGILFLGALVGLFLSALAGYLLAQRSLAPLSELTRTIEAITSSDLSARVHLHKPTSDFAWLASRFNSLLDRLQKAFASQRQFMADASHELRTPLTIALSATQVTARDRFRSPADTDETLSLVEEQILRLKAIVDRMLFLSQVDASSVHMERREFYLDDVISEAARAARALARTRQQNLRIGELPEAPCVGDEMLCQQAVLILLDNAVKYTPAGGDISVSLIAEDGFWHCRIWNDGPAIPQEAQSRIFDRFFRAANSLVTKSAGAGLGLSIARAIAESHSGSLRLLSSGQQGTTFQFSLPLTKAAAQSGSAHLKSLAVRM